MKNQFRTTANFFKKISESVFLFKKQWKENTLALFRSPRESDKTPFITEVIKTVAVNDRKVLYVNTEHRAESFAEHFVTNENLFIFTPAYESPDDPRDYADLVISGIEEAVAETDIRTFIIDSVTRIAALSFGRNASASYVMKRLASLQARYGISLLVIAHTSTKSTDRALTALADTDLSDTTDCKSDCRDATCCVRPNNEPSMPPQPTMPSKPSESSVPSALSIPPLSRRERRAIERQKRKLAARHKS